MTTTTIAAAQPRPMELLWSTRDVRFASRPVLVGDRLVAYVAVDGGAASALSDDTKPLVRLGPTSFTLARDDGTRLGVDVETGQALAVPDDSIGWCIGTNEFAYIDGTDRPVRYGEDFTTPCDLDGTRRPVPAAPDQALGAHSDGRFAWVDEAGLHTAREAP